jgi:hypothetical protein
MDLQGETLAAPAGVGAAAAGQATVRCAAAAAVGSAYGWPIAPRRLAIGTTVSPCRRQS